MAITSLQYTAEIFFFLSPDDANYHVVKSNGNASGQIEEWYCSTLTGSYTKTSTIGLNSQEGLNILHLPANGSAAEWRIYSEYGNGISVGYFYQDLTTGFTEIGSQHAVNSTLVQRNGKFSLCRVPIGAIPAFPTTGTLGAQDYDAATLASPKITGTIALSGGGAIAVATNLVISPPSGSAYTQFTNAAQTNSTLTIYDSGTIGIIGQYLCVLDSGWTSGGILFNGAAKTTCAFIGETGSHTLDIVLGSGSPALAITNNARNANVATMDNSGNLTLSGGTLIVGTLPTSNPHVSGQLYTAAGVVMQSTG